jgi:hypothetical protein
VGNATVGSCCFGTSYNGACCAIGYTCLGGTDAQGTGGTCCTGSNPFFCPGSSECCFQGGACIGEGPAIKCCAHGGINNTFVCGSDCCNPDYGDHCLTSGGVSKCCPGSVTSLCGGKCCSAYGDVCLGERTNARCRRGNSLVLCGGECCKTGEPFAVGCTGNVTIGQCCSRLKREEACGGTECCLKAYLRLEGAAPRCCEYGVDPRCIDPNIPIAGGPGIPMSKLLFIKRLRLPIASSQSCTYCLQEPLIHARAPENSQANVEIHSLCLAKYHSLDILGAGMLWRQGFIRILKNIINGGTHMAFFKNSPRVFYKCLVSTFNL